MENAASRQAAYAACPLFAGFTPQEIAALLPRLQVSERLYDRGEFLLLSGQPVSGFGIVLEGSLHVLTEDFWGRRSILGSIGPGELFGEAFVCAGIPELPVSVMADSRALVAWIGSGGLDQLRHQPSSEGQRLMDNLLRILAGKNRMLTQKIGHMSKNSTREKLLSYLSAEARRAGSDRFTIPFDRQQLADYLGVERSAMSAVLSSMRREGLVDYHKNSFLLKK